MLDSLDTGCSAIRNDMHCPQMVPHCKPLVNNARCSTCWNESTELQYGPNPMQTSVRSQARRSVRAARFCRRDTGFEVDMKKSVCFMVTVVVTTFLVLAQTAAQQGGRGQVGLGRGSQPVAYDDYTG